MKHFHFDMGDSSEGPIGMCARVKADDKAEALKELQCFLDAVAEVQLAKSSTVKGAPGLEYCNVYINSDNIGIQHIDEEDDDETENETGGDSSVSTDEGGV